MPAWYESLAQNTCRAALLRTVRTSVRPVAMSVTVNEEAKSPLLSPPSWPTRSISTNPGMFRSQSAPGAHRDLGLQQRPRLGVGDALELDGPVAGKPSVDGGRRHGHQQLGNLVADGQLAMPA